METSLKRSGSCSYHPHFRHSCFLCPSENSDPYWKVGSISWKRTGIRPIANCSFVTAGPSADVSDALPKTISLNLVPQPFLLNLFEPRENKLYESIQKNDFPPSKKCTQLYI